MEAELRRLKHDNVELNNTIKSLELEYDQLKASSVATAEQLTSERDRFVFLFSFFFFLLTPRVLVASIRRHGATVGIFFLTLATHTHPSLAPSVNAKKHFLFLLLKKQTLPLRKASQQQRSYLGQIYIVYWNSYAT